MDYCKEDDDHMSRKVSLYLILGLVLIGFCVAPVAAVIEIAQMANGDIMTTNDMCGNYWRYYDNSTGVWTVGIFGVPQSRFVYTPTSTYKSYPVVKDYTSPNDNAGSIIIPVQIINNNQSFLPKTNKITFSALSLRFQKTKS